MTRIDTPPPTGNLPPDRPEDARAEFKNMVSYLTRNLTRMQEDEGPTMNGEPPPPTEPTLEPPPENYSSEELAIILADLMEKLKQLELKGTKQSLEGDLKHKDQLHEDRMKKIEEAVKKMAEAGKANKAARIFGWIGASLAVVAAVAAAVATGGAATPLVVAAVFNVAIMACSEIKVGDKSLMEHAQAGIAKAILHTYKFLSEDLLGDLDPRLRMAMSFGILGHDMTEEQANIVAAVMVTVAVVTVNIVCAVMTGGATAGTSGMALAANIVKIAAMITSGTAMVGQGASQIGAASLQYQGAQEQAGSMDIKTQMEKIQALIDQLMDTMKEAMERFDHEMEIIMAMFQSGGDLKHKLVQTHI